MSEYWYIYSNGRCGTQFLARELSLVAGGDAQIVHEFRPVKLASRRVFRNPEALYAQLGRTPEVQRHFVRAENRLRSGQRFVDCGWPAFGWLDYFAERFGDAFRFIHLVRNPYDNAASHATHQTMMDHQLNSMERVCKIFGTDPNLAYPQFADRYAGFGTFERHLFHWLEVTTFACEHADAPGFRGLFLFEDLFAEDTTALTGLLSQILGRDLAPVTAEPFDRVHRKIPWKLTFEVDPELRAAVDALAIRLGYTQDALDRSSDPDRLRDLYFRKRFELPCDPSIPVVARH